jgi:hypothetical protein
MAVWGLKEERAVGKLPGADPATGSGCRAFELRLVERSGGKGGALRREVGPAVTTLGGRSETAAAGQWSCREGTFPNGVRERKGGEDCGAGRR